MKNRKIRAPDTGDPENTRKRAKNEKPSMA